MFQSSINSSVAVNKTMTKYHREHYADHWSVHECLNVNSLRGWLISASHGENFSM